MAEAESETVDLEAIAHGAQDGKKQELRLWLRMLSTTKLISQEVRRRLRAEFGATLPQFDLMAQLYRESDGLRLGELSKRTMVTNGNVTGLVERLEIDGMVLRETPHGDRRVTVAKLTAKGEKAVHRHGRRPRRLAARHAGRRRPVHHRRTLDRHRHRQGLRQQPPFRRGV